MSKLKTDTIITIEQFINLYNQLDKEDKYQELVTMLKKMSPAEAKLIIHVNNDEAFKKIVAPVEITYPPDPAHSLYFPHLYYHYVAFRSDKSTKVIKDGKKEGISIFLELDLEYFESLATFLEVTANTAEYIAKTAQEIRVHNVNIMTKVIQESFASNPEIPRIPDVICNLIAQYEGGDRPKIVISPHSERYLAEQKNNKDVDMNAEKYPLGSSARSNKSYMC